MKEILLLLAAFQTEEVIIKDIKDAITKWELIKDKEHFYDILLYCSILLSKQQTGNTLEGVLKTSEKFKKFEEREKMFNPGKQ